MMMEVSELFALYDDGKPNQKFKSGGINIMTPNGDEVLFSIRLNKDGSLDISAGFHCTVNGMNLDDSLVVAPCAANRVRIIRSPHKRAGEN